MASGEGVDPPRAWQRRKSHRRGEILAAARACLEEAGQQGISVEMIGRRAGVSEATVYKYFGSKHDLLGAVIEAWMLPVIEELRLDVEAARTIDARLYIMAHRHLAEMRRNPRIHEVVYRELRWTNYRGSAFHRYNQLYAGIFRTIIETAIARGELAAGLDIPICRDLFYGGLEHLGQRTFFAGREIDLDAAARSYSQTVLCGWSRREAPDEPDHAERLEGAVAALERLIGRHETAGAAGRAG